MELWGGTGEKRDAYHLLARLLSERYGLKELPAMGRSESGKPFFIKLPQLYFNVSHSGGLLLCAAGETPVGVDLERTRPRRAGLDRYALSDREYAWYEARGSRLEDFYGLWTLKEARCKCAGPGLDRPARRIAVPLLEPGRAETLDGLAFCSYGGEGWRAAACCALPARPPARVCWP